MLTFKEFEKLSENYDLIPVYREFVADMETPVSVLTRFADSQDVFLLESVENDERFGRYSFLGINPRGVFTVEHGKAYYRDASGKKELDAQDGALAALNRLLKSINAYSPPALPPLFGGAVGFLGYETANTLEKLPEPKGELEEPESAFMITDEMVIFDNQRHRMMISVCIRPSEHATLAAAYEHAIERISILRSHIAAPLPLIVPTSAKVKSGLQPLTARDEYLKKVELARKYIYEGEVIQLVLSQKFTAELTVEPLLLYRALRLVNPSPYTFFIKIGDALLIGSSPETLCKLENNVATLRPIAGTRRRGKNPSEDRAMADELLSDPKERAEHLMLVDLARNDLGRIALTGSVQVKTFMNVERYSHVMHLVSTVEALPGAEVDAFDLIRAAFPAGTLSGAPKIRAMELINELEESPRNAYGGAVGYFSYSHNMDMAITIRTLSVRDGKITVQAGAGIVADSDPAQEYEECCNKAAALFKSVELATNGLKLEDGE